MDGYLQSQTTVARRGRLIVGSYLPRYDADSGQVNWAPAALAGKVSIGGGPAADGEIRLDAAWLNAVNPGQLTVAAKERIAVEQALGFAPAPACCCTRRRSISRPASPRRAAASRPATCSGRSMTVA